MPARAQLAASQAQARVSRNEAGYSVLVADADGTVVETLAEPGQVVAAGQVVVRLARSGAREALIQLPETVRPAIGSSAIARTYSGATGPAHLRQLSNAADPATRTFEARYVLEGAPAGAPLGATVTVTLAAPGDARATTVPLGAIRDAGKGPGVWLIRAGSPATVVWRPVRISAIGAETATVASGLNTGDRFVAMGGAPAASGPARPHRPSRTGSSTMNEPTPQSSGFNLSALAVREKSVTLFFLIAIVGAGIFLIPEPWARRRSQLYHQGDDRRHRLAGSDRAGNAGPGRRAAGEAAPGVALV
ncbi:efflux RND transporter periplasmic adaptor subunit [Novosphingobium colocasiae]